MPQGNRRCDTCEHGNFIYKEGSTTDPDDRLGTCHHNSPRPSHGDFEYLMLKYIILLARNKGCLEGRWERWEDAVFEGSSWPGVQATDWCSNWTPTPVRHPIEGVVKSPVRVKIVPRKG